MSEDKKAVNHRKEEAQKKREHKAKLEELYGVAGNPKADKLYELAWGYGHSGGFHEVSIYYGDLVDLIR